MTDDQLAKLISADDLGLLTVKPKRTPQSTEEERLLDGFQQILKFVETSGAAPAEFADDMGERLLFARLEAIRANPQQRERLAAMEAEVDRILRPLTGKELAGDYETQLNLLRPYAATLARWMAKTALTTSYALPGKMHLSNKLAEETKQGHAPRGIWMDVAKARVSGIAVALTNKFPTFNGKNNFVGVQTHNTEACFQFCLQVNHLLLRVAMTPAAQVGYRSPGGLIPFRLFPATAKQLPVNFEYVHVNDFLHSVVLNTWAGCPGEVPTV